MKILHNFLLLAVSLIVFTGQLARADSATSTVIPTAKQKLPKIGFTVGTSKGDDFYWTVESWNESDVRFTRVHHEIEGQILQGVKRSTLLAKYRRAAMSKPSDAVAQFGWAYAAYRNYSKPEKGQNQLQIVYGIREALGIPESPRSYEYTRMRWFYTWWNFNIRLMALRILKNCAVRLLKHSPDDWDLKYTLAYEYSYSKESNARALQWAQEFAEKFPTRPSSSFLLGQVYESRLGLWLSQKDGLMARRYFQKYINSSLTSAAEKKNAQKHIDTVDYMISLFRKKGMLKP